LEDCLDYSLTLKEPSKRFVLSMEVLNAILDTALNGYGSAYGIALSGPKKRQRWGVLGFLSCLTYLHLGLRPSVIVALQARDLIPNEGGTGKLWLYKADRASGRPYRRDRGMLDLNRIQVLQLLRSFALLRLRAHDFIVSARRDRSGNPISISTDNLMARIRGIIAATPKKYPQLRGDLELLSREIALGTQIVP
jgi:hypothetical protein